MVSALVHHSKFGSPMSLMGQSLPKSGDCGKSAFRRIADIKCNALSDRIELKAPQYVAEKQ